MKYITWTNTRGSARLDKLPNYNGNPFIPIAAKWRASESDDDISKPGIKDIQENREKLV